MSYLVTFKKRLTHTYLVEAVSLARELASVEFLLLSSLDTNTLLSMLSDLSGLRYSALTAKRALQLGGARESNTTYVTQRQSSVCKDP